MAEKRITTENLLFIIAFVVALAVRLLRLGVAPLSDFEASWALQALDIARGIASTIGPNPGYIFPSGLLFFIFDGNELLARLLPALAGAGLVLVPYLFRQPLGQSAGVIMAFGLALDPGLVVLSRIVGSPMIAMGFGLLAIGLWHTKRHYLSGFFGAMALLGGPSFWLGLLGLLLTLIIASLLKNLGILDSLVDELGFKLTKTDLINWMLTFIGTIIVVGTFFLIYPQGLGAVVDSLPVFLQGWFTPSGIPASRLVAALVFYQPLALTFGSIAVVRGWLYRKNLSRWLSIWLIVALIISLGHQDRYVWDVAWTLIPLWGLAGIELSRYLRLPKADRWPMLGEAILIFVLGVIIWLNLTSAANVVGNDQIARLRWVVILGAFVLGVITTILVALGWSSKAASHGLVLGICISLGVYVSANMWSASQVNATGENELWSPLPYTRRIEALVTTLVDLSEKSMGSENTMEIVAVSEAPSLQWALRDWGEIRYSTEIFGDLPPVLLKSGDQSPPSQTVAYRGQGFGLWVYPSWNGALPLDWPRWLVFREAPHYTDELILWARGDLFPDGSMLVESDADILVPTDEEEFLEGSQE